MKQDLSFEEYDNQERFLLAKRGVLAIYMVQYGVYSTYYCRVGTSYRYQYQVGLTTVLQYSTVVFCNVTVQWVNLRVEPDRRVIRRLLAHNCRYR